MIYGQYMDRLRSLISTTSSPYDFVIVQGGGNDLTWLGEPKEIFEALRKVWSIAFDAGSIVIALTVTKTVGASVDLDRRYDALNELIVNEKHEKLYSVDVSGMLPPATVQNVGVTGIYDKDGVHLRKKGYEMMGDAIAFSLLEMNRAKSHGDSTSQNHHFNAGTLGLHTREDSTPRGN